MGSQSPVQGLIIHSPSIGQSHNCVTATDAYIRREVYTGLQREKEIIVK